MKTHQLSTWPAVPLLLAATLLLPTTAHAQAAEGCPAVEAIAVPGTTQTTPAADPNRPVGILGNILEPLKKHTHVTLATYYTPYPATIFGTEGRGYLASKQAGIDSANARMKAIATRCPSTMFLLTGYSQGADVAGDIAAAIGHNKGIIPANRLLGVALIADPSQSPVDQPTIGLNRPGMGFAGVRTGGFGALTQRNAILSICAPLDYFCNLPQNDLVMRLIGHLGSHLDPSDPAGSAQKLATIFMAGLVAPATAAINQIIQLVSDPNLIPNLIHRGVAFAQALAQQLFWLAGPQVAATASDLVNTATQVINLVQSRAWTAIPALVTAIATKAAAVGTALSQMHDKITTVNVSGFGPVGTALAHPGPNFADLATTVINAVSIATGGIGTQATGIFGPTFAQFSAATVASALKHFAEFINGNFHNDYDTTRLDPAGHTGTQLVQRYFFNQLNKLV
ncbi:cutinase family protein [Mycobacterium xenopi]|uniref:cutinase family protein n=1 Tax=Mycobacterium xenopi TaxID=1789 RepID=UPI000A1487A0|nr:cutinase family protein [Mycobacterium xenopi]ORX14127.1 cutinase [Mycobacterium xenopi]SPX94870.1 Cutinase [Mycobacterium xenopi]